MFWGEPQPAIAWVAHIMGIMDSRDYTITMRQDGTVDDPTFNFERDGIPGIASAFALECAWKKSAEKRFHPMEAR